MWLGYFWLSAAHAKVHVQNMRLDLVAGPVMGELRHLKHLEDSAWISITPFDKRWNDRFQIGRPQFDLSRFALGKF
jgi:hypothetical protein